MVHNFPRPRPQGQVDHEDSGDSWAPPCPCTGDCKRVLALHARGLGINPQHLHVLLPLQTPPCWLCGWHSPTDPCKKTWCCLRGSPRGWGGGDSSGAQWVPTCLPSCPTHPAQPQTAVTGGEQGETPESFVPPVKNKTDTDLRDDSSGSETHVSSYLKMETNPSRALLGTLAPLA